MKLPWVSREQYDDMERSRDYERENAQLLRRELFASLRPPVEGPVEPMPAIIVLPDPIRDVIRDLSDDGGRENHALASHLRKHARQLKREEKTDDEIVAALLKWQTTEASLP